MSGSTTTTPSRARSTVFAGILTFGFLIGPTTVAAQPARVDPIERAISIIDAGLKAQTDGDYAEAIHLYLKANAIAPHPILHYNLGQAHRLAAIAAEVGTQERRQHREEARRYYREYLRGDPAPAGATVEIAQQWLVKLDLLHDQEHGAEEAAALKQDEAETAAKEAAEEASRKAAAAHDARLKATERSSERRKSQAEHVQRKAGTLRLVGLGLGGLGLAAFGSGATFGVLAVKAQHDLDAGQTSHAAQRGWANETIAKGERYERYMVISYVTGAVLMTAAVITYVMSRRARAAAAERVQLTPVVNRDQALLVVSGNL